MEFDIDTTLFETAMGAKSRDSNLEFVKFL
jgi:hypothetical protein